MDKKEIVDEITDEEQYKINIKDEFRLSIIFVILPIIMGIYLFLAAKEAHDVGVALDNLFGGLCIILSVLNAFNLFMQYILWNKPRIGEGFYLIFHILFFITSSISALPFFMMTVDAIGKLLGGEKIDILSLGSLIEGVIIITIAIIYVLLTILRIYNLRFRSKVDIYKLK